MSYKSSSLSIDNDLKLFIHRWPVAVAKAQVLIVHGYAEHGYRYDKLAKFLNERQIEVISYDQRGHGRSDGLQAYVDHFDLFLDDLSAVIQSEVDAEVPLFVFGHSMGGLVAAKYCLERDTSTINGLITSAAALKLDDSISAFLLAIIPILSSWFPKLKTQKLERTYLTRSKDELEKYNNDPLIYQEGTKARMGHEMIKAIQSVATQFEKLKIPYLGMHGKAEKITDYRGTQDLYNRAMSKVKGLKLYENLYHELINEPESKMVMNDIGEWIDKQIA